VLAAVGTDWGCLGSGVIRLKIVRLPRDWSSRGAWFWECARRGAGRQEGEVSGVAFGLWLGFVPSPSRMACPKGNHISQGDSAFGLGVGLG
jgi:hypothetical protein